MGKVRLEIRPWLSAVINSEETGSLVLEKEITENVTLGDLLRKLAVEHKAFGEVFFDPKTHQPSSSVAIVINDQLLQSIKALETNLDDGDTVTLLPFLDGG